MGVAGVDKLADDLRRLCGGLDGLDKGDARLVLDPALVAAAHANDQAAVGQGVQRGGLHGGKGGVAGKGIDDADGDLDFMGAEGAGGSGGKSAAVEIVLKDPAGLQTRRLRLLHDGNGILQAVSAENAKAQSVGITHGVQLFSFLIFSWR